MLNLENFKQNQQHLSKLKLLFLHFPQIEKQEKQNCKNFPRKASWLLIEVIYYPHNLTFGTNGSICWTFLPKSFVKMMK